MERLAAVRRAADEDAALLPLDLPPLPSPDQASWSARIRDALLARSAEAPDLAEAALIALPGDPALLLLGALTTLAYGRPVRARALLKRYLKRFRPTKAVELLTALALAQEGQETRAAAMLRAAGLDRPAVAERWFVGDADLLPWLHRAVRTVLANADRQAREAKRSPPRKPEQAAPASGKRPLVGTRATKDSAAAPQARPAPAPPPPAIPDLPRLPAPLRIAFAPIDPDPVALAGAETDPTWFRLRAELNRLSLFEGFDELLCLPTLRGVEPHWYQIETVRKVLRTYRGRVLLADEVGLGKTIEAGMVVKEYVLRGMAERVLILTPAALVGQWREEMETKFGLGFATTQDALLREAPERFWDQPRIIASIATARRKEHAVLLGGIARDVVVVDEAHHLRDQQGASYRLVESLRKRFLLLLSATPVQNSLLELYTVLTLLSPGIFKTAKEFRAQYMVPGKPREPVNQDRLRALMRGAMVRNTRALTALRLPRRHAATERVTPGAEEAACYEALGRKLRAEATGEGRSLAARHLLAAAGSSPAAAAAALARFAARRSGREAAAWQALAARYGAIGAGAKEAALLALLARNPDERKLVFVHQRDSLDHLAALLGARGTRFARFDGTMTGAEKDRAVAAFRDSAPVLLSSESGGEGRNLQFCNTLINFDIPWNPMAIEQRIGRIDRIGQTREVFVFNLATMGTIEQAVLGILDEKINMFELVVGEVGAILGALDEERDFPSLVLDAWLESTEQARGAAFDGIAARLVAARGEYEAAKALDSKLFGNELDAA